MFDIFYQCMCVLSDVVPLSELMQLLARLKVSAGAEAALLLFKVNSSEKAGKSKNPHHVLSNKCKV